MTDICLYDCWPSRTYEHWITGKSFIKSYRIYVNETAIRSCTWVSASRRRPRPQTRATLEWHQQVVGCAFKAWRRWQRISAVKRGQPRSCESSQGLRPWHTHPGGGGGWNLELRKKIRPPYSHPRIRAACLSHYLAIRTALEWES